MLRWLSFFAAVAVVAAGVVFYLYKGPPEPPIAAPPFGEKAAPAPERGKQAEGKPGDPAPTPAGPWTRVATAAPRVVIPGGRLIPVQFVVVPSLQDGQLLFLGREVPLKPGEQPPPGAFKQEMTSLVTEVEKGENVPGEDVIRLNNKDYRLLGKREDARPNKVQVYHTDRWFLPVDEGTKVQEGDLLAVVDPVLALDELSIRVAKLDAAESDRLAAEKIRDYYREHWQRTAELYRRGAATLEEMSEAKAGYDRYIQEAVSKGESVKVAAKELRQVETTLAQHSIRSTIKGEVKTLGKHKGEAVRKLDPVMEMVDYGKLRIKARVDLQDLDVVRDPGSVLDVEATRLVAPLGVLTGHFGEVTGVAVSQDDQVVSVSEDRTARVWEKDLKLRSERQVLWHPAAVRAVACTPLRDKNNLCLTGAADGVARLFDLAAGQGSPVREFTNGHKEAINSVAFSPDGRWAVTGGDDRAIYLWEVDTGKLLQRFPAEWGHKGGVTSVTFLPVGPERKLSVVSAGRDYRLIVWTLKADGAPEKAIPLDKRGGEVTALGVNLQGGQLLFDQGKHLHVLSSEKGALVGSLSAAGGTNFGRLAQFSPDGNLILTSGGPGRLGLWRAPTAKTRGHEYEQLVWTSNRDEQATTNCGAFAPDGSLLVTGTANRNVIVWPMPKIEDVERPLTAKLFSLDPEVNTGQVRVTAELDNPGYLLPGDVVTIVVYPQK